MLQFGLAYVAVGKRLGEGQREMCSDAAESDAVAAAHHRKKKKRQLPISKATYMVVPGIKEEDKLVVVT